MKTLTTKELNEISFDMAIFLNMFEGMDFNKATIETQKQLQRIRRDQRLWTKYEAALERVLQDQEELADLLEDY